jgi:hypothetical protein
MFRGDGHRRRVAFLLMFGGMAVVLLATALYISYEQKRLPPPTTQLTAEQKAEIRARIRTPMRILLAASALTLGFLVASYVFLGWSRGYRSQLTKAPAPPTPVEDVWMMHRLPDDAVDRPDKMDDETDHE